MENIKNLVGSTVYVDFFNLALGITGGEVECINCSVRTKGQAYANITLSKDDIMALKKHLEPKITKEKEDAIAIVNRIYSKL